MRWSGWIGFGASVVPLAAASGFLTWAAASLLSPHISDSLILPLILSAALIYLGIHVASEKPIVAASLLLLLGVMIGGLVARFIPASRDVAWGLAALIMSGLLVVAFGLSHVRVGLVAMSLRVLWIGSWVCLLGWVVIALLQSLSVIYRAWALLGAVVFTGLAAGWFANLDGVDLGEAPRHAASLYLIGVNVLIALVLGFGVQG